MYIFTASVTSKTKIFPLFINLVFDVHSDILLCFINQINTKVSISLIHIMTKLYMEKNPENKIHTIIKVFSLKGVKLRSITHGNMSKMTKFSLKKAHEKRDNSHWTV